MSELQPCLGNWFLGFRNAGNGVSVCSFLKISWGACLQTPLVACAFGARTQGAFRRQEKSHVRCFNNYVCYFRKLMKTQTMADIFIKSLRTQMCNTLTDVDWCPYTNPNRSRHGRKVSKNIFEVWHANTMIIIIHNFNSYLNTQHTIWYNCSIRSAQQLQSSFCKFINFLKRDRSISKCVVSLLSVPQIGQIKL